MQDSQPTTRFSDRVTNFVKYRPGYPSRIYPYLLAEAGLRPGAEIADLGSGTGLLSKLFLSQGHKIYAVEPNAEMRSAGEELLANKENFVSLEGRAEEIPLPDRSVDFVTAGQSFHWFDAQQSKLEVARILRPPGQAALIWNNWDGKLSPFLKGYEELLRKCGTDFKQVSRQSSQAEKNLRAFFAPREATVAHFPHQQLFDFEGLRGRLLSSSYAPLKGYPKHAALLKGIKELFKEHACNDKVRFDYQTSIYHAKMG